MASDDETEEFRDIFSVGDNVLVGWRLVVLQSFIVRFRVRTCGVVPLLSF